MRTHSAIRSFGTRTYAIGRDIGVKDGRIVGVKESCGSSDGQPGSYFDVDTTDCILMVGHNMSSTDTVLWRRVLNRRRHTNPPQLIVIDPRTTITAREADLHLAPRIGTNVALLNGLLHLLIAGGHVDKNFLQQHTVGFSDLAALVADHTPERVEEISKVPAQDAALYPDIANLFDSLGEAQEKKGDTTAAIMSYRRSLELNPKNQNASAHLAVLRASHPLQPKASNDPFATSVYRSDVSGRSRPVNAMTRRVAGRFFSQSCVRPSSNEAARDAETHDIVAERG